MHPSASEVTGLPEAETGSPRRWPSIVWLVPLAALVIGGWLVYRTLIEQGPTVIISLENAEGIEAGKTEVRYRDVSLGLVHAVRLAKDGSHVDLSVQLIPGSESRLTETTRFWVVRPRLEGTRISGLGTLLSGAYIAMDPGAGGAARRSFVGLEEPPKVLSHRKGTLYRLRAAGLGSVGIGSPVYFREFRVGDVVRAHLASDHAGVEIEIFVDAPHDRYVRASSRFWNVSGLELSATADGVRLELESLTSLIEGGLAFETPDLIESGTRAPAGYVFTLYKDERQSRERPLVISYPYLVYFDDSVRGLAIGAPVEFLGIRIGTVTDIRPRFNRDTAEARIAVLLGLEPERIGLTNRKSGLEGRAESLASVRRLVERGMRAQLKTGNLLTGQLFIDFGLYPNAEPAEVREEEGYAVLPTVPSTLTGISEGLSTVLAKLEKLPLEEIGRHVEETAAGANRLVNDVRLQQALSHLNQTLAASDRLLATMDARAAPLLDSAARVSTGAEGLVAAAEKAAEQARVSLATLEGVATEDGPVGNELVRTLRELAAAARSLRVLTDYLARHPESLLKGKRNP